MEALYYQDTDILIFVVDSNDQGRISDATDERLQRFLSEDELKDCILLVLANKQDLANAMSVEEVIEKMKLNSPVPKITIFLTLHKPGQLHYSQALVIT